MPLGLLALALGGFGIGLTEFVIMGLLPEVAADFGVTEAAAGWFISGYALAVVVGARRPHRRVTRLPRKPVLVALIVLFIAGNRSPRSPRRYEVMMAGRIVAALCHGAFFGIGSVRGRDLVAPGQRAGAIAMMFAGLTTANVLGVPFGTLPRAAVRLARDVLGDHGDRRASRSSASPSSCRAARHRRPPPPSLRGELAAFRSGQVWLSLVVTVLGFGGMFGAFTYIAYTLTEVSGFATGAVPWLLVLFGVGPRSSATGRRPGRRPRRSPRTLVACSPCSPWCWSVFALTAGVRSLTRRAAGADGRLRLRAPCPGLQMRIMTYADQAPTLASGANIAAFNLGNALGAWIGGVTITAGLGYTSPIWVGAGLTAAALVVLLVADRAARRTAPARRPAASRWPSADGPSVRCRRGRVRRPAGPAGPWPGHPRVTGSTRSAYSSCFST